MSDPIGPCSPLFIVSDIAASLDHYTGKLGFECRYLMPEETPFFAVVRRGTAQIMLKDVGAPAMPNRQRHPDARLDAFIYVPDPDALATELATRAVILSTPLADTGEGLRGFEVTDPDGHVCFFGRPA